MKKLELEMIVTQLLEENEDDLFYGDIYIGIRFEDKERTVGEICEASKDNTDREDERDFPEFGSDEYNELDKFDGTSAWDIREFEDTQGMMDAKNYIGKHAYVVVGESITNQDCGLDYGEIVIKDAKVLKKLW